MSGGGWQLAVRCSRQTQGDAGGAGEGCCWVKGRKLCVGVMGAMVTERGMTCSGLGVVVG